MKIFKRILFYFLSFTWGFIMSFIGLFPIAVLACMKKVHVYHGRLYGVIGKHWGGVNFGCFFLVCEDQQFDDYCRAHECGHGIQNLIWGPLMPFVISIPSAIRYWYRELHFYRKDLTPNTDYYDIWFEKQASLFGINLVMSDKF